MDSTLRDCLLIASSAVAAMAICSVVSLVCSLRMLMEEMERNRARRRR